MNMTQLNDASMFRTSDIALTATIHLLLRPLEAVDKTADSRKAEFLFLHDAQLDGLVEQFWRGEIRVEPKAFSDAMRAVKSRLYG